MGFVFFPHKTSVPLNHGVKMSSHKNKVNLNHSKKLSNKRLILINSYPYAIIQFSFLVC